MTAQTLYQSLNRKKKKYNAERTWGDKIIYGVAQPTMPFVITEKVMGHFSTNISFEIQMQWTFRITVIPLLVIRSLQMLAFVIRAQLSSNVMC